MADLYILEYNNYYNRIVKKENTLQTYLNLYRNMLIQNVNFIPGDDVNTSQVLNIELVNFNPNYIIVADSAKNIISRWFVIDYKRTTFNQYEFSLHRDLVVDNYDTIINSDFFIEKAMPKSIRDPSIYNSEDMTFNQIKISETPLYDETQCPWIVGYIPNNAFETATEVSVDYTAGGLESETLSTISNFKYYNMTGDSDKGVFKPTLAGNYVLKITAKSEITGGAIAYNDKDIIMTTDGTFDRLQNEISEYAPLYHISVNVPPLIDTIHGYQTVLPGELYPADAQRLLASMPSIKNQLQNFQSYLPTDSGQKYINDGDLADIMSYNNQIIYVTDTNSYYKVIVNSDYTSQKNDIPIGSSLSDAIINQLKSQDSSVTTNSGVTQSSIQLAAVVERYWITLQPYTTKLKVTIPSASTRYHIPDAPYDIFCMPFGNDLLIMKDSTIYLQYPDRLAALTIAQKIASKVGSGNIYDIQILPYCPLRGFISGPGEINIRGSVGSAITLDTGDLVNVLMWCSDDSFSFRINALIREEQDVIEKKIKSQTDFIRISSPNFSNSFQFNPQMNNGVEYFNVFCHYKPYNPYIKVQPNFKGLYGTSFNDGRGLICNGDFSVTQLTNAWANYELQNKNYQNIFNREIQNMEVTNSVQKTQEIFSAIGGTATGAVGGAMAGTMIGGPVGTVVGGLAGGLLSGVAGAADIGLSDKLRNEALDYKRDMFGYQLGNIKALPNGLAKCSAISEDNRYVPFIEYYSCTDEEKKALRNKIKFNGATIMMIGKISDYMVNYKTYIKGKLIRFPENISMDFHTTNAIAEELFKGVFI